LQKQGLFCINKKSLLFCKKSKKALAMPAPAGPTPAALASRERATIRSWPPSGAGIVDRHQHWTPECSL
jgi:hypothetical protein